MKPYWCRFYVLTRELGFFEYEGPWWMSGYTMDDDEQTVVCAAVMADSEDGARKTLEACFDEGHAMARWDNGDELGMDWQPSPKGSGSRFQRAEWMRWPWPEAQ